jgi:hypothetical protein
MMQKRMKSWYTCDDIPTPMRHKPVIKDAKGNRRRTPNLSTSPPSTALDVPLAKEREVLSHPKRLREIPKSLDMGMMNSPRLRVPVVAVAKFTTHNVAAMTHP